VVPRRGPSRARSCRRSGERTERLAAAAAAAGVDLTRPLAGVMLGWGRCASSPPRVDHRRPHRDHPNVALAAPAEAEAEIAGSRDAIARRSVSAPPLRLPNSGGEHRYFDAAVAGRCVASASARRGLEAGAVCPERTRSRCRRLAWAPAGPVSELAAALARQRLAA